MLEVSAFKIRTSSMGDECARLVKSESTNRRRRAREKVTKDPLCRSDRSKKDQFESWHYVPEGETGLAAYESTF